MKPTKIYYKRLFSMPDYQNKEVGIEIDVTNEDSIDLALQEAIEFVEKQDPHKINQQKEKQESEKLKKAQAIINDAGMHSEQEVIEAAKTIREIMYHDLPF